MKQYFKILNEILANVTSTDTNSVTGLIQDREVTIKRSFGLDERTLMPKMGLNVLVDGVRAQYGHSHVEDEYIVDINKLFIDIDMALFRNGDVRSKEATDFIVNI